MYPIRVSSKLSLKSERSSSSSRQVSAKRTTFKTKNLLRKRNDLSIFYNDDDVTPRLLAPIESSAAKHDILSLSQLDIRSNYQLSIFGNLSASVLHSTLRTQSVAATYSYVSIVNKEDFDDYTQSQVSPLEESEIEYSDEEKPGVMPTKINIILTETPIIYLLEIPSITEVKGTPEGDLVEKDNETYDYLTVGKGRNRKTTNAETQTAMTLYKTRSTYGKREKRTSNFAFVSKWDMYDTYNSEDQPEEKQASRVFLIQPRKKEPEPENTHEAQMEKLLKNRRFQRSVLIMERVLANNVFNEQQKRFRGLIVQDPFRADIEFRYNLDLLWTFKSERAQGHPVTTMQWHPYNSDMLAVGYGKFYYSDMRCGFVFCWNIKNPVQPEREVMFEDPVTCLAFSRYEPNLLAVGLYDGTVVILDISRKKVKKLMASNRQLSLSFEPIWQLEWFALDDYNTNENHIIGVYQNGRVCSFVATKTNELMQVDNVKLYRTESKLKGVYQPKVCAASEIPVSQTSAGLTITKHPVEEVLYYVGTSEGSVHKCSEDYVDHYIDIFMAHAGPVYRLQFSHFLNRVFLTCGGDSCINIWVESIKEPLATLSKSLDPIEDAEWNPANSTMIANISGNLIYLWDLQRKTYLPASEKRNPANCRNTVIRFTASGTNLVVGDIEGNVHVFNLTDVPFPPFYQGRMLEQVLHKNLITKKEFLKTVKQVGMTYIGGDSAL